MRRTARLSPEPLEDRSVPASAYALTADGANLLLFDTATPGTIQATIPVTGLVAGDVLVGTDFRPATGQLYGVAANGGMNTLRVYTLDLTGAATPVGGAPITLAGNTITGATSWAVDINPSADRIRVTNNLASDGAGGNANNLRLNPNNGTLTFVDPDLDFTGLPGGNGNAPEIAVAYTNSQFGTATGGTTTLFGVLFGGDRLVTHTVAPGFATLVNVGSLGVTTGTTNGGLDIFGPNNGANSSAVAALRVGGVTRLYTVNLNTGAATLVGPIGDGVTQVADISVAPPPQPVTVSGPTTGQVQLLTPVNGQGTVGTVLSPFGAVSVNVRSVTADVNGDTFPDLVAVTGPGTPIRVTVISGADNSTVLVPAFDPFGGDFTGGGFVTAADVDLDGKAEFAVTPDQGGGPRVTVFAFTAAGAAAATKANFLGIDDANFRGGARAAFGDVNNDNTPDLVVGAGFLGGPRVALFNGTTLFATPTRLINDFFAFPGTDATTLRNGVFVAAGDVDGDGNDDLIFGGGPGGAPRVFILSGALVAANNVSGAQAAPVANFFVANNSSDRGGVRLAAEDLDGDLRADVAAGSGEGSAAKVRLYLGKNFTTTAEPTTFQDVTVFGGAALPDGVYVG